MRKRWWIGMLVGLQACAAVAVEVRFEPVAENVYVHVGDVGARSVSNEGLIANLGLVVTPAGAVLIDSGATWRSAREIQIQAAARRVSTHPTRWVINTGGQDHRWFGNGYFQAQGAELIAHAAEEDTVPTLPERLLVGPDARLELGGTVFEFRHRGGGHTPGDMMVERE